MKSPISPRLVAEGNGRHGDTTSTTFTTFSRQTTICRQFFGKRQGIGKTLPRLYCDICNLQLCFQQLHLLCRQPSHIHDRCFIHTLCQHLLGNLKASLGHALLHTFLHSLLQAFLHAFCSTFLHALLHALFHSFSNSFFFTLFPAFLVSVIQKGSFDTY